MGVEVHVDLSGLNRKLSAESLKKARKLMANDALQAMDKWVPYLEGNLSKSTAVATDGSAIWYYMPYAKAQFYGLVGPEPGYPVHHYTTATHKLASKRWDLKLKGSKDDMEKVKSAFIKGTEWNVS
ncbi:minor capsid protein [Lactobacillus crispatus]|uniref:minor capsid protein n=1 Tax=Lactobacillus crispatus TaxID=47770 RepID=UPI0018E2F412|nr:minor capsid protein [Lactobacillus crispatus]MBI1718000.1 phage capsid protein [Lactobacillus crispatus]